MPLSDIQVRNAKPQEKAYKLTGGGRYVFAGQSGGGHIA